MHTRCCKYFLIMSLTAISAHATNSNFYLGASVAASFAQLSAGTPRIEYFSGTPIIDAYPNRSNNVSTAVVGVNGGYEWQPYSNWPVLDLGLGVYTNPGYYNFSGQLVETAVGNVGNLLYDYTFQVQSTRLMAELQLNWQWLQQFYPFINLGIGPAWNQLSNYAEVAATANGYPPLPPFQNNSQTQFAYQVGLGISMGFNAYIADPNLLHERLTLGYRYANMGQASLANRGIVYPYALQVGTLSTNEVYLGYTHLF